MLGENIAALRKKQGMSQQSLAEALFVTRQTISKWEKNLSVPDADALVRLADALDVSVQALLGQPEEASAAPSDVAVALTRLNDQFAIQNRRRSRIWKVIAWVIGLYLAFNVLVLVLGFAASVQYQFDGEGQITTVVENLTENAPLEEPE